MTDLEPRRWRNQYQRLDQVALVDLELTAASAETKVWTRQSSRREGRKQARTTHLVLGREPQDLGPWETGRAEIVTCQFGMISLRRLSVQKDGLVTHLQKPGKGVVLAKQAGWVHREPHGGFHSY